MKIFTPGPTCNHQLRTGPCQMDAGHHGRHTTQTFWCDGCNKVRRGQPTSTPRDENGEILILVCFMCCIQDKNWCAAHGIGKRKKAS